MVPRPCAGWGRNSNAPGQLPIPRPNGTWDSRAVRSCRSETRWDAGDTVLCGGTSDEEIGDRILPNGCRRGHCRRAQTGPSIKVSELRADILALLSCNSFSVAKQLVPTSNSLALAAVAGEAVAVVANPLSTVLTPSSCALTRNAIVSGVPLGEATRDPTEGAPGQA